jgi:Tol biopolymer transport system component
VRGLTTNVARDDYPKWSPDANWIAFHSDRSGTPEIYLIKPDGGSLWQLTSNDKN